MLMVEFVLCQIAARHNNAGSHGDDEHGEVKRLQEELRLASMHAEDLAERNKVCDSGERAKMG